ncbi:CHC2 zinc finger domain-containing protein [Ramlibacter sp. PS3R-8]|uniref:CHC2 zinc finger domain-containing protein n=1 Tax=Ramlibacter sp. PS3R-8 TaxID=3133437 RepID=UPI0030B51CD1
MSELVKRITENLSIRDVAVRLGLDVMDDGRHAKTRCLYHRDTRPSMFLYERPAQGSPHFHCYSCGAHGDIFELVKKSLGLNFKQSVDWLATSYGLKAAVTAKTFDRRPELDLSGFQIALDAFKGNDHEEALTAFLRERQIPKTVAQSAEIHLSLPGTLTRRVRAESHAGRQREILALLDEAKLLRRRRDHTSEVGSSKYLDIDYGYQDFFFDSRIVFPIYEPKGTLSGFAGRRTPSDDKLRPTSPKYLYTPGLERSKLLYRLDRVWAKTKENKEGDVDLYLCEGALDALRLESAGHDAVALLGSSLSDSQVRLLNELESTLSSSAALRVWLFLDRDDAGHRGAARAASKLLAARIDVGFIFPTRARLEASGISPTSKDADEIGRSVAPETFQGLIESSKHPAALVLLAAALGDARIDDLLDEQQWLKISPSRRYRAAIEVLKHLSALASGTQELRNLVLRIPGQLKQTEVACLQALLNYAEGDKGKQEGLESFLEDAEARLNHARFLAQAGSRRGELPADEPAWERIDVAATAFNRLLRDRLGLQIRSPLAPLDAVYVSRGFGKTEPRLKTMPSPEDLIVQQYVLNELLSERADHHLSARLPFSNWIPAVRYYRTSSQTLTTGLVHGSKPFAEPLSFAYQIDMDVLEGRQPPTDQGMFRPFMDCWNHFMASLKEQTRAMPVVYALRLDASRYYDRIRRYVIRDQLGPSIAGAVQSVPEDEFLWTLMRADVNADPAAQVVDWLCDQTFGYRYLNPRDGTVAQVPAEVGIPQGPVLSAWLGTIALFPVDLAAFEFMQMSNIDGQRVGYARYVDDVVLVADSPDLLSVLRERVEEAAAKLKLSIIPKVEPLPPMAPEEFAKQINSGRVLAGSVPAWEPPLIPLGDGEVGWDLGDTGADQERQTALEILRNSNLYGASVGVLLSSVSTAFQAVDLRPTEIPKGTRWIWYAVTEPTNHGDIWRQYWSFWGQTTKEAPWKLNAESPWEDPVLFALEGLEKLIESCAFDQPGLTAAQNISKKERIKLLCTEVLSMNFFEGCLGKSTGAKGVGKGALMLQRQFWRRFLLLAWKASKLAGIAMPAWPFHLMTGPVRPSLFRDLLSVAEGGSTLSLASLDQQSPYSQVSGTEFVAGLPFVWLHHAVAAIRGMQDEEEDPLQSLAGPLRQIEEALKWHEGAYRSSIALLQALTTEPPREDDGGRARALALLSIAAIARKEMLLPLLRRRPHLIDQSPARAFAFPPLPGLDQSGLIFGRSDATTGALERIFYLSLPVLDGGFEDLGFWKVSQNQSDVGHPLAKYTPAWERDPVPTPLALEVADWPASEVLKACTNPSLDYSPRFLHRLARLFDVLARINYHQSSVDPRYEYVTACPYIFAGENHQLALICVPVETAKIANRAVLRDMSGNLRSVEVPMQDAPIWRIGVAMTDLAGAADDLIRYEAHDSDFPLEEDALANPARFVLRSQLKKLRGAFSGNRITPRSRSRPHLPSTVARSLKLLEEYPEDPSELTGISYLLATDIETAAMRLRYEEQHDVSGSGTFAHFVSRCAMMTITRLPVAVAERMPAAQMGQDKSYIGRTCGALIALRSRIERLPEQSGTVAECLSILNAGLAISTVTSGLRSLVLALVRHGGFALPREVDPMAEWSIGPAVTVGGTPPDTCLFKYLKSALGAKGNFRALKEITPLGWLTILGAQLGLIGESSAVVSGEYLVTMEREARWLANVLSLSARGEVLPPEAAWPFEILDRARVDLFDSDFVNRGLLLIESASRHCGLRVRTVDLERWPYDPRHSRFVDGSGRDWPVDPWVIDQIPPGERKTEEVIGQDGAVGRRWSEIVDVATGRLLLVNVLGRKFAELLGTAEERAATSSGAAVPPRPTPDTGISESGAEPELQASDLASELNVSTSHPKPVQEMEPAARQHTAAPFPGDHIELLPEAMDISQVRERLQAPGWANRKERVPAHVRVAILQFRIDDSYRHPLVEAGVPKNLLSKSEQERVAAAIATENPDLGEVCAAAGNEHRWLKTKDFPSWPEFRRRKIIEEALQACSRMNVDLLVLPEYSVRPETVSWVKEQLAGKNTAVLAGSYRVFDAAGSSRHLAACMELLYPLPATAKDDLIRQRENHEEEIPESLIRGPVLSFRRHKKYRSIAMEEFIRPTSEELLPLFTLRELVASLERQGMHFSSAGIIALATAHLPLRHFTELICSELFLLTSPANYYALATDYKSLSQKFGMSKEDCLDIVLSDLRALAACLGTEGPPPGPTFELPRRGLVTVPAATTRTADYWICGQSALLAAGLTTIFCNAVGSQAKGGSCFIGRNSWKTESDPPGMVTHTTPYHGWSKGIYYSRGSDPLSTSDQAMVVADIDPAFMSEGKPRPQMLHLPLQLVAYLPIVELITRTDMEKDLVQLIGGCGLERVYVDSQAAKKAGLCDAAEFEAALKDLMGIVQHQVPQTRQMWTAAVAAFAKFFSSPADVQQRLEAFVNNAMQQPSGTPWNSAALYDWLAVDLSLRTTKYPNVTVGPWTDKVGPEL